MLRHRVGRNLGADQRRLVVTKRDDGEIIGIDKTFHDNNDMDAELNGNLEADPRRLVVTKGDDGEIIGIDEIFHDSNDIDGELDDKRGGATAVVYAQVETLSIGATSA